MSDFTKFKIGIALALLGVLFTLQPLVKEIEALGFVLLGIQFKLPWFFYGISALLGLSVYLYAVAAVREQPPRWFETAGNVAYACALAVPPFFILLWLSSVAVAVVRSAFAQPLLLHLMSGLLGAASAMTVATLTRFVARVLANRDRTSRVDQLETAEVFHLDRARQLHTSGHYDLSVLESFRAVEAALSAALEARDVRPRRPVDLLGAAVSAELLPREQAVLYQRLRTARNSAVHKETPTTGDQAGTALDTAKAILGGMRREREPQLEVA